MSTGIGRIAAITRREYRATVRRREFLLITFGLPLLYLVIGAVVVMASISAATSAAARDRRERPSTVIGFHSDAPAGFLSEKALAAGSDDITGRVFPTDAAGQAAVRSKAVRAFVSIPADYAKSRSITLYLPPKRDSLTDGADDKPDADMAAITHTLRRALLAGKVDTSTLEAAIPSPDAERLYQDPKTGAFAESNPLRALAKFVIPYAFSIVMLLSVVFSSSYLLHGIVDEKENRIIEVLLSAVTAEQLLAGKLIGLGAAGLTQFGIWLCSGLMIGALGRSLAPAAISSSLHTFDVSPGLVVAAIALFLSGYALYAALTVGVGSFGTSWRESQQIGGIFALFLVIPLLFLPVILEEPDGALSRTLSFIPLTAPIGMMMRLSAGGASVAGVVVSVLLLAVSTWGAIRLAARLFRLSLLLTGQRPSAQLIVRYLRYGQ